MAIGALPKCQRRLINRIDELDRKLLALLVSNRREITVILGRELKVSRGTVSNRQTVTTRQIQGLLFAWHRSLGSWDEQSAKVICA